MNGKLANPAPLGLFGFATTTWCLSLINAGLMPEAGMGAVLVLAFAYGGSAQFVAGVLEYPKGNTFGFVAFCSYGAFWWTFALLIKFMDVGAVAKAGGVGWYLLVWGVFSFVMWIGTFRTNRTLMLIFLALWITFLFLIIHAFTGSAFMGHLGGYLGLLTAALAAYLGAADVINEMFGRTVLPVGPYNV